MEAEVRSILLKMKAELSAGWIQGDLSDDGVGVCLYGALVRAGDMVPTISLCLGPRVRGRRGGGGHFELVPGTPTGETVELLARTAGVSDLDLALWNDMPGRTAQDVVDLIDEALVVLSRDGLAPRCRCGIGAIDELDLRCSSDGRIGSISRSRVEYSEIVDLRMIDEVVPIA